MNLKIFSAALLGALVSLPARGAQQICNSDMETLLRVHASRDFEPSPPS